MQNKQVKIPFLKKEEIKEMYYHFGWVVTEEIDAGSETILKIQRDDRYPFMSKVMQIEKQYHRCTKKVPLDAIIILVLSFVLIVTGILVSEALAKVILILLGSGFGLVGLFLLLSFFIIKINFSKIKTSLYKKCDELLFQNMPDLPIGDNVAIKNEATDDIKNNVRLP